MHTVSVVLGSWSGTHTGDGTETATTTPIVERDGYSPKIRWLNDEELTLSGLGAGAAEIGPITPDCTAGGTSLATLLQTAATTGQTVQYLITGPKHPNGALYMRAAVNEEKALHYSIRVVPVADT